MKPTSITYDKTQWTRGPWDNEPDRVDFIHAGFSCMIIRNTYGNLCGYVGIPTTHQFYNMNMYDIPVDVHGGLTYKDKCQGHICHVPEPGMPDDVTWLGFDTAHSGDLSPAFYRQFSKNDTYKDISYVRKEVESLAEQLARF